MDELINKERADREEEKGDDKEDEKDNNQESGEQDQGDIMNGATPTSLVEKIKKSYDIAFEGLQDYIKEDEKILAERDDRSGTRMSSLSITTMTMFQTFGRSMNFPPIIGTNEYKKSKYLGLCTDMEEQAKIEKAAQKEKEAMEPANPVESPSNDVPAPPGDIPPPPPVDIPLPPGVPPPPPLAILNSGPKPVELKPLPGGIPPPPMLNPTALIDNLETKKKEAEERGEKFELGPRCKLPS